MSTILSLKEHTHRHLENIWEIVVEEEVAVEVAGDVVISVDRRHILPVIAGVAVVVIDLAVVAGLVLGGSLAVSAAPEDLGADRGDLEVIRANLVSV